MKNTVKKNVMRLALVLAAACAAFLLYADHSPRMYHLQLTATGGGAIPAGLNNVLTGEYRPGTKIRLAAREEKGYDFERWTSSGGGEFDDPEDAGAVFVMPEGDVVLTAHFGKD